MVKTEGSSNSLRCGAMCFLGLSGDDDYLRANQWVVTDEFSVGDNRRRLQTVDDALRKAAAPPPTRNSNTNGEHRQLGNEEKVYMLEARDHNFCFLTGFRSTSGHSYTCYIDTTTYNSKQYWQLHSKGEKAFKNS